MVLAFGGLMVSWTLFISPAWAQTYVSGKVITSDGMVVASGAVALEKGELHNNAFLVGGAIGADGTFKIPLPSGGPWGLHVSKVKVGHQGAFRFWPVGTRMIIEIYEGNALQKENDKLIEIAAMSKIKADKNSFFKAFYPINWTYARFEPDGNPSITSAKVRDCHQCHSIAFHLTGDLIFSQFP